MIDWLIKHDEQSEQKTVSFSSSLPLFLYGILPSLPPFL